MRTRSAPSGGAGVRSHARPASIDMGPHTRNGIGPNAADDTGDVPHRQNVYIIDAPRDDSVAPERQKHNIVVQKHGQTLTSALHAKGRAALARKRSSDVMRCLIIAQTGLRSISVNPCRSTWGHAPETVVVRMPLTI